MSYARRSSKEVGRSAGRTRPGLVGDRGEIGSVGSSASLTWSKMRDVGRDLVEALSVDMVHAVERATVESCRSGCRYCLQQSSRHDELVKRVKE